MKQAYSRRSFIMGSLATGALVSTGAVLGGCGQSEKPENSQEETTYSPAEVIDVEVVICGGGMSGLAAAVQAGEMGMSTLLVEKMPEVGGNGLGVEGIFAVNSSGQQSQGIKMNPGEVIRHELEFSKYQSDGALWTDLVEASPENYDWLLSKGVKFSGLINSYGGAFDTMHWFYEGNAAAGYVPFMSEQATSSGVEIMTNAFARELISEGGAIRGVYVQREDESILQVNSKAVILATGGFGGNLELVEKSGWKIERFRYIGTPGHDGDGTLMATAVGARDLVSDSCSLTGIAIDGLDPLSPVNMALCFGGPFIWVNEEGRRCVNEDLTAENMMNVAIPLQESKEVWCIANNTIVNAALASFSDSAAANSAGETAMTPEEELAYALEQCPSQNIFKANTLKELAELMGMESATLEATVDSYNKCCAAGEDTQFAKNAQSMLAIEEGPYYGYRLDPTMRVAIGGIGTNRNMQVIDTEREPIEGLYAVGVDGCMLYRNVYPINVAATCCANNVNSGRAAIKHIQANL